MAGATRSGMVQFRGFGLDCNGGGLFRLNEGPDPVPVPIGWRALEVLSVLVQHPGATVSRSEIIDAVWPGIAVGENNLTVQISALRRVLDAGTAEKSCIQTVPGRGYRFVGAVTRRDNGNVRGSPVPAGEQAISPPRLSMVILPFVRHGDDADEDRLADAMADHLTTELARLPGARVIARRAADQYRGATLDIRRMGEELGVRYLIDGSVHRTENTLHVRVRLNAAQTSALLWASQFDQQLVDGSAVAWNRIAGPLTAALILQLLKAENARGMQERPDTPDALDLLLRAWPAWRDIVGHESMPRSVALFEQALRLDPLLVPAMCGAVVALADQFTIPGTTNWADEALLERAADWLSRAQAVEPHNERVLFSQGYLLSVQARFAEACAVLQRVIAASPNDFGPYRTLARAMIPLGHAEQALPLFDTSVRGDPLAHGNRFADLWAGYACLLAQREEEALPRLQRALAGGQMSAPAWRHRCYLYLASAHALLGNREEARHVLAEANRLWPFATVRGLPPTVCGPRGRPAPAFRAQIGRIKEGLRLAGLRDHAGEDADFGVAPSDRLHVDLFGYTPACVPGAATISTGELAVLLKSEAPILIDVALETWGWSLPGAIGLQGTGSGSEFSATRQSRFERKIRELTRGDLSAPIVAFCTNSERFTGYNLALRLVALGYRNVRWYRGGWEAWLVSGFPEAELSLHDW